MNSATRTALRAGCKHPAFFAIAFLVAATPPIPATARSPWYEGELRSSFGFDFRSGDFGRDGGDTDIWSVPMSVEYRFANLGWGARDRVRLKLSLPWVRIEGPDRGEAAEAGAAGVDEGIGDLSLKGAYRVAPAVGPWPYFELSGRVKIPTASENANLGTGEVDFTLEGQLSKRFRLGPARVTPFVTFGHKWVGDPPESVVTPYGLRGALRSGWAVVSASGRAMPGARARCRGVETAMNCCPLRGCGCRNAYASRPTH